MDANQLAQCTGSTASNAALWLAPITEAMAEFGIDTPSRQAAFLAQIGHESDHLAYAHEIWGPTTAQRRYEGRSDLGNTQKGDGELFKGRGLIQITGRANYAAVSDALHYNFIANPSALEQPEWAAESAAWFWKSHGLNELADSGDFPQITRRINGGLNGYADRFDLWQKAREVLT